MQLDTMGQCAHVAHGKAWICTIRSGTVLEQARHLQHCTVHVSWVLVLTIGAYAWPGRIGNRQVRRAVARRGVLRRTPLKMGKLITPRVTWPPFDAGLSMELAGTTPEGVQLFRYVHSTAYRVSCFNPHSVPCGQITLHAMALPSRATWPQPIPGCRYNLCHTSFGSLCDSAFPAEEKALTRQSLSAGCVVCSTMHLTQFMSRSMADG